LFLIAESLTVVNCMHRRIRFREKTEYTRIAARIPVDLKEGHQNIVRPPDIVRIAPVPLYNTYHEIWQVVQHLKDIIEKREYERFSKEKKAIS